MSDTTEPDGIFVQQECIQASSEPAAITVCEAETTTISSEMREDPDEGDHSCNFYILFSML